MKRKPREKKDIRSTFKRLGLEEEDSRKRFEVLAKLGSVDSTTEKVPVAPADTRNNTLSEEPNAELESASE